MGHALLAFALVAAVADRLGRSPERALTAGAVAAGFAALPDLDMWYAFVGAAGAVGADGVGVGSAFWTRGNVVHRTVTHSLPVAAVAALAAACWVRRRRALDPRFGAATAALVAGLIAVAAVETGPLGAAVMATFGVGALGLAAVVVRATEFDAPTAFALALAGGVSHPFGDLFAGTPPALLYPFDVELVAHRIALHPEPTLNLLAAFGVELAAIWAAVAVFLGLTERSIRTTAGARATAGFAYAAGVVVVPAPTLEFSYPFVLSVLAVGAVGLLPTPRRSESRSRTSGVAFRRPGVVTAAVTGLAAVTVAWGAYGAVYVLI